MAESEKSFLRSKRAEILAALPSYGGELELTSALGKKVKVPDLNHCRGHIKILDIVRPYNPPFPKDYASGVWVYRDGGSLGRLDRATLQLMLLDNYPYTYTDTELGNSYPWISPLPPFAEGESWEALIKHKNYFETLIKVFGQNPGGWLSVPGKWGGRIADKPGLRFFTGVVKLSASSQALRLEFKKVPVPSAIAA